MRNSEFIQCVLMCFNVAKNSHFKSTVEIKTWDTFFSNRSFNHYNVGHQLPYKQLNLAALCHKSIWKGNHFEIPCDAGIDLESSYNSAVTSLQLQPCSCKPVAASL